MTFANNLDPDEAPQNVGLHLRSKLFDIHIIYQQKQWVEAMIFFKNIERNNFLKKLRSMLRVNSYLIICSTYDTHSVQACHAIFAAMQMSTN